MNKKGQMAIVGLLVMSFVAIVVGVSMLYGGGVSSSTAQITTTTFVVNQTVTAAAVNGTVTLSGREMVGTPIIRNATNNATQPAITGTNFTVLNNQLVNNQRVLQLQTTDEATKSGWAGRIVNVTYTYKPEAYSDDAGTRAITELVLVFMALAVVAVALIPTLRNGFIDLFD